MYHLRAIEIMSKNIKFTVPYLSHLIQSYDKHYIYKKELEPIAAIVEESALSITDITGIGSHAGTGKKDYSSSGKKEKEQ